MARGPMILIQDADLGSHPEAHILNAAFRPGVPILKLRLEVEWDPEESRAALAALEAQVVELCPGLREHQCRGQEEYHILRSTDGRGSPSGQEGIPIEAALALAHLYEHVLIDTVAFISGAPLVSGATAALRGSLKRFDIFVESPDAVVASLTVGLATRWMHALVAGGRLNSEGRTALELTRYLYRTRSRAVGADELARGLGRREDEILRGLVWLERNGLASRIAYSMNFSGLPYYRLAPVEEAPLALLSDPGHAA